jgi:NADPH:quinone reductase-like Zn-dependent oxidoreductase
MSLVHAAGAERVIDYTREVFTHKGQRYDVIVDIGGSRSLSQLRCSLAPNGTLVLVGGEGGNSFFGGSMLRSIRAMVLSPFVRPQQLRSLLGLVNLPDLQAINVLIESGQLTPVVDRTYSLPDAADAVRTLQAGRAHGKQVISI